MADYSYRIPSDQNENFMVGTLEAPGNGTSSPLYSIVGGNTNNVFKVGSDNGVIEVNSADYGLEEYPMVLSVRRTDDAGSIDYSVEIDMVLGTLKKKPVIYVDPVNGNNASNGDMHNPLSSLDLAYLRVMGGGAILIYSGNLGSRVFQNKPCTLKGLKGSTPVMDGLALLGGFSFVVDNIKFNSQGVVASNITGNTGGSVIVRNCDFSGDSGILVSNYKYASILKNTIHPTNMGMSITNVDEATVRSNTVYSSGSPLVAGFYTSAVRSLVLQNNTFDNIDSFSVDDVSSFSSFGISYVTVTSSILSSMEIGPFPYNFLLNTSGDPVLAVNLVTGSAAGYNRDFTVTGGNTIEFLSNPNYPATEPDDPYLGDVLVEGDVLRLTYELEGTDVPNDLYSWGKNSSGQQGDGTTIDIEAPERNIAGSWSFVDGGLGYTMAINAGGYLWAWGSNNRGKLGTGGSDTLVPVQVGSSLWSKVDAGQDHTLAIGEDGSLHAWGWNVYGSVGDGTGTGTDRSTPVLVDNTSPWVDISASYDSKFSLGVKQDSNLYAWGLNETGQFGDGTVMAPFFVRTLSPSLVGTGWSEVSAGVGFSIAKDTTGHLFSTGSGLGGQLGLGSVGIVYTFTQIGTDTWESFDTGRSHTAAIRSDGTLWTWGVNAQGQLGVPSASSFAVSPVQVGSDSNWSLVVCGENHTVALKDNGEVWAFGDNTNGQLGDPSVSFSSFSPIKVGEEFTYISAGHDTTYGFKEGNVVIGRTLIDSNSLTNISDMHFTSGFLAEIKYNNLYNSTYSAPSGPSNIDADPLYVDPASGDYSLENLSPNRKSANPSKSNNYNKYTPYQQTQDIKGANRAYKGEVPDIGSIENLSDVVNRTGGEIYVGEQGYDVVYDGDPGRPFRRLSQAFSDPTEDPVKVNFGSEFPGVSDRKIYIDESFIELNSAELGEGDPTVDVSYVNKRSSVFIQPYDQSSASGEFAYVDMQGSDDTGDGSFINPYRTIGFALSTSAQVVYAFAGSYPFFQGVPGKKIVFIPRNEFYLISAFSSSSLESSSWQVSQSVGSTYSFAIGEFNVSHPPGA